MRREAEFTGGPWQIVREAAEAPNTRNAIITAPRDIPIAELLEPIECHGRTDEGTLANALLIAAAPCLYWALRKVRTELEFLADSPGALDEFVIRGWIGDINDALVMTGDAL